MAPKCEDGKLNKTLLYSSIHLSSLLLSSMQLGEVL